MKQYGLIVGVACLAMVLFVSGAYSNNRTDDALGIAVAPHTLVLSKSQGAVSVHSYIPYSTVELDTLLLTSDVPGADSLDVEVRRVIEELIDSSRTPEDVLRRLVRDEGCNDSQAYGYVREVLYRSAMELTGAEARLPRLR